jgi:hypothetical protein
MVITDTSESVCLSVWISLYVRALVLLSVTWCLWVLWRCFDMMILWLLWSFWLCSETTVVIAAIVTNVMRLWTCYGAFTWWVLKFSLKLWHDSLKLFISSETVVVVAICRWHDDIWACEEVLTWWLILGLIQCFDCVLNCCDLVKMLVELGKSHKWVLLIWE